MGGATNVLLLLPLKLRYGAELLPFAVSSIVNGSNADPYKYLMLPLK